MNFEISKRLVESMRYLRLNNDEVALTTKIGVATIIRYRNGRTTPKETFIDCYCESYNLNKDWFIKGEGTMIKSNSIVLSQEVFNTLQTMYNAYKEKENIEIDLSTYIGKLLKDINKDK